MTSLKMLMDADALAAVESLAREFSSSIGVGAEGYRISVPLGEFDFSVSQYERYEKYVSCSFDFEDGCSFQFETVRASIEMGELRSGAERVPIGGGDRVALKWNSRYVVGAVEFLMKNKSSLVEFPPPWFLRACEIEADFLRPRFPDIASSDLQRKLSLWSKWRDAEGRGQS